FPPRREDAIRSFCRRTKPRPICHRHGPPRDSPCPRPPLPQPPPSRHPAFCPHRRPRLARIPPLLRFVALTFHEPCRRRVRENLTKGHGRGTGSNRVSLRCLPTGRAVDIIRNVD